MTGKPSSIFVAWQDPNKRRFHPVARLTEGVDDVGTYYEFAYIRGALEAQRHGFFPFLSFPDFGKIYRSRELFPLFANRVMSPSRMEFPQQLERLGLLAGPSTDAWSILSREGGRRVTDTVELFPMPLRDPQTGVYRTYFLVHAIRYLAAAAEQRISSLKTGDQLLPMLDCQNPHDPDAIALRTSDDRIIVGYMPAYLLEDVNRLNALCFGYLSIFVERVNPLPAPVQQRLLCKVETCWPEGFTPFSSEHYQPLVGQMNDGSVATSASREVIAGR